MNSYYLHIDQFCLHWSCYPSTGPVISRGGATPMQTKWIKLDLAREFITTDTELIAEQGHFDFDFDQVNLAG